MISADNLWRNRTEGGAMADDSATEIDSEAILAAIEDEVTSDEC
jgi:hypothetical protein